VRSFYLNPETGDIEFDRRKSFVMVEGDDELVQSVGIALKTNKGEWFLNPDDHGFDRTVIQSKKYDEAEVTDALYETIFQDPRVSTVEAVTFDFDKASRKLSVGFTFTKQDGETVEGAI
jgi:hypothetical protein